MLGTCADEGEDRCRRVAGLFLHHRKIQRPAVQSRRRTGLQPSHAEGHVPQPLCKPDRRCVAGAATRPLGVPDQDAPAEKRADGEHHRGCDERIAVRGYGAGDAVALHDEVDDIRLGYRQAGLRIQQGPYCAPVKFPVSLCAGGANRGTLARVQGSELDARTIDGRRHDAPERIDFARKMPLADAADRRVAAHLPECRALLRDQQGSATRARGGRGGLRTRVTTSDHDDVVTIAHGRCWSKNEQLRAAHFSGLSLHAEAASPR